MLDGHRSIAHYTPSNIFLWMIMAFQAGVLNIGGFMSCGRFVSHVTGFAGYFGYEMGRADYLLALGMLAVPIFFLLGAMISGQLVEVRLRQQRAPRYYISFGVIFALIAATTSAGMFGYFGAFGSFANDGRSYILLAALSLACGLQNGMVTTVSKAVIRTTHLSGITTDLGLALTRLLNRRLFTDQRQSERRAIGMRLGIIGFFSFGSAAGAIAFFRLRFGGFLIPLATSLLLFVLSLRARYRGDGE